MKAHNLDKCSRQYARRVQNTPRQVSLNQISKINLTCVRFILGATFKGIEFYIWAGFLSNSNKCTLPKRNKEKKFVFHGRF